MRCNTACQPEGSTSNTGRGYPLSQSWQRLEECAGMYLHESKQEDAKEFEKLVASTNLSNRVSFSTRTKHGSGNLKLHSRNAAKLYALSISVDWWYLDWQVSSVARIINSPSEKFSAVEASHSSEAVLRSTRDRRTASKLPFPCIFARFRQSACHPTRVGCL